MIDKNELEQTYQTQALLFRALMHPTRLAILDILRDGEQCVCHMEATLGYRQAYISQHLMVLREANLVEDRREGWNIFYRVTQPEIYAVLDEVRQMLGMPAPAPIPTPPAACPCPHCQTDSEMLRLDEQVNISKQMDP